MWAGRLADKLGRRNVLWLVMSLMLTGLLLTLSGSAWLIVPGIGLFTFGFFASHSVASSWVQRRAQEPKALASAIYLLFYYLGSSVVGSICGTVWSAAGWPGSNVSPRRSPSMKRDKLGSREPTMARPAMR